MSVNYNPRIVTDGLVLALDVGNIKSYPGTSTQLITNGTFDSNVVGWTTSNSTNTWSSGKMQITRNAVPGGPTSYQVITTVPGVTYAISAEVNSSGSQGQVSAIDGTGYGGTILFAAAGTYLSTLTLSGTFTATSNTTSILFLVDNPSTSIIVDNVSVSPLWIDLSGNVNNGTLGIGTSSPTYSSTNGGSLVFDGTNDFIDFTSDSNLLPTAGLTVSVWFKSSVVHSPTLVDKSTGESSTSGYRMIGTFNGSIEAYVNGIFVQTPSSVTTGNWINLVFTWTPSTSLILYQNSAQVSINTTSIPASITNPSRNIRIAARNTTPTISEYFNGNISQVSIYNRALTAAEVSQNFNATRSRFSI